MTELQSPSRHGDGASKGEPPGESYRPERHVGGNDNDSPGGATVCVIDDDASIRKALARLLQSTGYDVQTFASSGTFLARSPEPRPACIVLDVQMPDLDGLGLQERLSADDNAPPVVFLSGHADIPMSVRAMKKGAMDFLTKPVDEQALRAVIEQAIASDEARQEEREEARMVRERLETLTSREHDVLRHVIAGRLNKQIAGRLGISEKTVKVHRGRMMDKMSARSVAELVRLTAAAGIEPA